MGQDIVDQKIYNKMLEYIQNAAENGIKETRLFTRIGKVYKDYNISDPKWKEIVGGPTIVLGNMLDRMLRNKEIYKLTINRYVVVYYCSTVHIKLEIGS